MMLSLRYSPVTVLFCLMMISLTCTSALPNNSTVFPINSFLRSNCSIHNESFYDQWNDMLDVKEEPFICNKNTCKGNCKESNVCDCGTSYAPMNATDKGCNYQRKSQTSFFVFEALLSFGIGHLIVGNTLIGLLKLLLAFTPCLFGLLSSCSVLPIKHYEHFFGPCTAIVILSCALGFMIWWFLDIIFILGTNLYVCDSNGRNLEYFWDRGIKCPYEI